MALLHTQTFFLDNFALRQYAALTNGLVLLVFIATMVTLVRSKAPGGSP